VLPLQVSVAFYDCVRRDKLDRESNSFRYCPSDLRQQNGFGPCRNLFGPTFFEQKMIWNLLLGIFPDMSNILASLYLFLKLGRQQRSGDIR
jgi:hypothetical protein